MLCIDGTPDWQSFYRDFAKRFVERFPNALPHWGEIYWDTARFRPDYGEDMVRFLEIREQWDPKRMFLNDFLERDIFQLPPLDETRAD